MGSSSSQVFLTFFLIARVVHLQKEVLNFKQREKESLGASWAHLIDLYSSGPDLAIPEPILLQYFYLGLSEKSTQFLDITSGGAFLHLSISEGRAILDTILEYTDVHDDSPEEKDNPILCKKKFRQSNRYQIHPKIQLSTIFLNHSYGHQR